MKFSLLIPLFFTSCYGQGSVPPTESPQLSSDSGSPASLSVTSMPPGNSAYEMSTSMPAELSEIPNQSGQSRQSEQPSQVEQLRPSNESVSSVSSVLSLTSPTPYRNETIERPCEIFDIYCIREYFAEHSNCKKRNSRVPDPFYRSQTTVFLSRINLTVVFNNAVNRGLNGRIREFYINKETDKLVLTIEFRNLVLDGVNAYFRFHRRGQEPIVTNGFMNVTFNSLESTIIIPDLKNLRLEDSEVFTYVGDAIPIFRVNPDAFLSTDPNVERTLVEFLAGIPINIREGALTFTPFYPATFIQYTICDFGLQIL